VSALPLPDVPTLSVAERLAQLAALTDAEAEPEAPNVAEGAPVGAGARCAGGRADGTPCTAFRLRGSLFCQWHDPDRRAREEAEREEQGRRREAERTARATAREREAWACGLETPAQLAAFVALVTRAAWDRRIAPDDARVCLEGARLLAELRAAGTGGAR
jgi:hypothetical protein